MKKLGTVQNEDGNEEAYTHVRNKEKEKERKKKKKAKLEINDNEKEFEKAREKDKRINDGEEVGELREVSKETNMIGEENMNVRMNDNKDSELGIRREKKKKHRVEKRVASYMNELLENNNNMEELVKGQAYSEKREKDERKDGKEEKKKEKKKRKRDMESCDVLVNNCVTGGDVGKERELSDGKSLEKTNPFKKRRKENKSHNDDLGIGLLETITEKPSNESKGVEDNGVNARSSRKKMGEIIVHAISAVDGDKDVKQKKNKKKKEEKKKRKAKSDKQVSEQNDDKRVARTKKGVENIYENSTPGGTSKRVRFSDHLEEVFTLSDGPIVAKNDDNDGLVRGKRFSQEEDEMVKKAVFDYIAVHGLGDEGLNMVLHCKSHSEIKNCWKEIGTALPWRPSESVYHRAHVLFERGENRKWTPEEYELIRSYHDKHGSKWKKLADKLGKHRFHVKDTWRRIRLPNMKKGRWEQEEYQTLFDLVNMDLRMKALEEKKKKNWKQGMLRDDLSWEAISNKLGTRSSVLCCQKWYNQLTSPMVREGVWANTDDYHLIDALYNLDACCIQDVDWDNLLEDRSGDVCRERWDQMVKHIGEHGSKSFPEQVEILSQRYCTDVLEARENCDRKPEV